MCFVLVGCCAAVLYSVLVCCHCQILFVRKPFPKKKYNFVLEEEIRKCCIGSGFKSERLRFRSWLYCRPVQDSTDKRKDELKLEVSKCLSVATNNVSHESHEEKCGGKIFLRMKLCICLHKGMT